MIKHFLAFLIFFLILLAFFPRGVEVLNGNPVFSFDQGRDYLAVKNIVVDHKLTLIGAELGAGSAGISYLFHGPFYYYTLAIPFLFLAGDPRGGVIVMFLLSFASVFLGLYITWKIFKNLYAGLVSAFLIAISPPLVTQARFVWNSYPSTFFILLSFFFTYKIPEKKYLYTFLAAFFAGFVYNYEFAIAVPLSIALLSYSIFIFKKNVSHYLVLVAGFLLAYSPMLAFEFRHDFQGIRSALSYTGSRSGILDTFISIQPYIIDHYNSFVNNFLSTFIIDIGKTNPIPWLIFLFVSIYLLKNEKKDHIRKFMLYLISLIPFSFLVFLNLKNSVWDYYLVHLHLAYIFLFTYIIYASYTQKNRALFAIFGLIFLVIVADRTLVAYKTTVYDISDYGGVAKLNGKVDAIDAIYKDAKGEPFGLFVFSPPVYVYPYDYVAWWYGNRKYGYLPTQSKEGLFYLLIEPDPNKPWTYKGWIETVIKSGNVDWIKTMPSGFIIEKRRSEL